MFTTMHCYHVVILIKDCQPFYQVAMYEVLQVCTTSATPGQSETVNPAHARDDTGMAFAYWGNFNLHA